MSVTVAREGETVVVRVPMAFRKRSGRREIVVPAGAEQARLVPQEPLVAALARAFHWQELLDAGRYASVTELAEALGLDRCYVRRILGLAGLAPDIVQAIVAGREPSGMSLEGLVKAMPMGWEEQRKRFGFPTQ